MFDNATAILIRTAERVTLAKYSHHTTNSRYALAASFANARGALGVIERAFDDFDDRWVRHLAEIVENERNMEEMV